MKRLSNIKFLFFYLLICQFVTHSTVFGSETGLESEYREIGRYHSDSDSFGSKVTSQREELFLNYDLSETFSLHYSENQEVWNLTHPDGTRYFSFNFKRHIPKIKYRSEDWKVSLSLPIMDVVTDDQLYSRIDQDDQEQFLLPAFSGELHFANWFVNSAIWQESDIYALDYYRYSLFLYQTKSLGGGLNLTSNQVIRLSSSVIERIYPSDYKLNKDQFHLSYQFLKPLEFSDSVQWSNASLQYTQTRFPNLTTNKLMAASSFKFSLFNLTHFIDYQLLFTDAVTYYKEGVYQYSLIEIDEERDDIRQIITYSGFTRIGGSNFFLNWRYRLDDSLVENTILDQLIQLKLVYTF